MPDDHSEVAPLLPIPNRTVKRFSADDSAGSRVKVGHRQALTARKALSSDRAFLISTHSTWTHMYMYVGAGSNVLRQLQVLYGVAHLSQSLRLCQFPYQVVKPFFDGDIQKFCSADQFKVGGGFNPL